MIEKCPCQHCNGHIEFDVAEFEFSSETSHRKLGQTIDCPHCGKRTQIYINRAEFSVKADSARTKPKFAHWKWLVAGLIVLLAFVIFALCNRHLRGEVLPVLGVWGEIILCVVVICLLVVLAYLLIVSGIVLQAIIWALIGLGLYLCFDGFFLKQSVEESQNGTIYQQFYATTELVGGALVFVGR